MLHAMIVEVQKGGTNCASVLRLGQDAQVVLLRVLHPSWLRQGTSHIDQTLSFPLHRNTLISAPGTLDEPRCLVKFRIIL